MAAPVAAQRRVKVIFTAAASVDYDLATQSSLRAHIDYLCGHFNAPGARDKYTLQMEHSNAYLTETDLRSEGAVPSNAVLRLKLQPKEEANVALANLRDLTKAMKACVELRSQLKDPGFVREFVQCGGVQGVVEQVLSASGNTLAYALRALEGLLALGFGFRELGADSCIRLIGLLDSGKNNVVQATLEILTHLARHPSIGAALLGHFKTFAEKNGRDALPGVVRSLDSPDLNTKLPALHLINALVLAAGNERDRLAAVKLLLAAGTLEAVRAQLHIENQDFRAALFTHQLLLHWGMRTDRAKAYDRNNAAHEQLLSLLWRSAYPGEELTGRVSEQWKKMGFQGTDPATDFRGMGLLGLKHLLYFACVYKERFRRLLDASAARAARDYPVAVAGINVSLLIWELFHLADDLPSPGRAPPESGWPLYAVLFDHAHALEEIYCAGLELLDRTWDELNASYMDFPRVIAAVRARISEALASNPPALPALLARLSPTPQPLYAGPLPHAFLLSCSATASSQPDLATAAARPVSPVRLSTNRPSSPPNSRPSQTPTPTPTTPSPAPPSSLATTPSPLSNPALAVALAPLRAVGSSSGSGIGISPRSQGGSGAGSGIERPAGMPSPSSLPPPPATPAPSLPSASALISQMGTATGAALPAMSLEGDESAALAGMQSRSTERQVVSKLKGRVFAEAFDFVRNAKLSHLKEAALFRDPRSLQKGAARPSVLSVRLAESGSELLYGAEGEAPHVLKMSDVSALATGLACPLWNAKGAKKPDEVSAALCMSLLAKDGSSLLDLMAASRSDFAQWSDGLRVLLGGKMEHPETLDDIRTLADLEMDLRLLDLEGVDFPSEAPAVPDPPPDLDFAAPDPSLGTATDSMREMPRASPRAGILNRSPSFATPTSTPSSSASTSTPTGSSPPAISPRNPNNPAPTPTISATTATRPPLQRGLSSSGNPTPTPTTPAPISSTPPSSSPAMSSPLSSSPTSLPAPLLPVPLPPPPTASPPSSPGRSLPPPPSLPAPNPPSPRSASPLPSSVAAPQTLAVTKVAIPPRTSAGSASPSPGGGGGFVRTQPTALKGAAAVAPTSGSARTGSPSVQAATPKQP